MKTRILSPWGLGGSVLALLLAGLEPARAPAAPGLAGAAPNPAAATPAPTAIKPAPPPALRPQDISECLIDAIIAVESQGNPRRVGSAGERGLMQLKRETWRETTRRLFGHALPFEQAFDPVLNRRVGRAYLAHLHARLRAQQEKWNADERALLVAAYNAGPTRLAARRFSLDHLHESTQDYVERVTALHDQYLALAERALSRNALWADAARASQAAGAPL